MDNDLPGTIAYRWRDFILHRFRSQIASLHIRQEPENMWYVEIRTRDRRTIIEVATDLATITDNLKGKI